MNTRNNKNLIESILIFSLSRMPLGFLLVDTISGFILYNGLLPFSISILYKFSFIVLCFIWLLSVQDYQFAKIFVLAWIVYMSIWGVIGLITNEPVDGLITRLLELFKLGSIFIMFYALSTLPHDIYHKLKKFYFYTLIVILVNILLSLLGFGLNSYGDYGAKGFLFGGNALSSVILIVGVYYLAKAYSKGFLYYFFVMMFFILISFIVGTKSAILGVFIATFLILILKGNRRDWVTLILLSIIVIYSIFFVWEIIESTAMYTRLSYFYYSDGLERLLFSGRLDFLSDIWSVYINSDINGYLFGIDKEVLSSLDHDISEMDITDILFSFGFITLIIYLLSFFVTMIYIYKISFSESFLFTFVTTLILFLIGTIAGHVLFNGVVTPFWALVLALPVLEFRQLDTKMKNHENKLKV